MSNVRSLFSAHLTPLNPNNLSMKKLLLSFSALLVAAAVVAQPQLHNSSFETWEGSGGNAEPVEWSSIKTSTGGVAGLAPQVCFQSTDAHTGSSSVRLRSVSALGQVATGLLTNGRVHAEISGTGYVYTIENDAAYNTALTDRPDSIVVWYKATPVGSDFPGFEAVLHTGAGQIPAGTTGANWIGTASWSGTAGATVSTWTRISAPFVYTSENAPAFILLAPTSGNGTSSVANSEVLYDDFALIYNITPQLSDVVAPVTATEGFALTVDFSTPGTPVAATDFVAELSDASGSFASPVVIGTLNTAASSGAISAEIPANTPASAGYMVRVTNASEYYASLETGIEVTQDVVGLAEATADALKVFGANGLLTVDLNGVKLERPTYEVFTLSGQRMAHGCLIEGQQNRIDLSGEQGMFIVRILDANNAISKKVSVY